MKNDMFVLGIETSCDETAVSVVKNGKIILSNVVSSSVNLHARYGGIVPEIATRFHVEYINYVLRKALKQAKIKLKDIDLIATTCGPGLIGSLLVGISQAKALSYALKKPLIGINHLKAHIWAPLMQQKIEFPFVGLVVSGGHTSLVYVKDMNKIKLLGQTQDDAAGEAFDKVAAILDIGYPGGPIIERYARCGDPYKISFPRAYLDEDSLDFSFSGIKTAVLYYITRLRFGKKLHSRLTTAGYPPKLNYDGFLLRRRRIKTKKLICDICASFQEAVVEALIYKTILACEQKKINRIVVGGGVSANARLREVFEKTADLRGINVFFPSKNLSVDNAAMVAGLGFVEFKSKRHPKNINRLQAYSNMSFMEG